MACFGVVGNILHSWNGKNLTIDCLNSLKNITYPNAHVIVIDNGSTDGSVDAICNQFHEYEIIQLAENFGFSQGNNAGFKSVKHKSDYTIFLNNGCSIILLGMSTFNSRHAQGTHHKLIGKVFTTGRAKTK